MASLSLQHINKTYPNGFQAVKDFNLSATLPTKTAVPVTLPIKKMVFSLQK